MLEYLDKIQAIADRLDPAMMRWVERGLKRIPFLREKLDAEYEQLLGEIPRADPPGGPGCTVHTELPRKGRKRLELLSDLKSIQQEEEAVWRDGFASGAVYHGDRAHIDFLGRVYQIFSQLNPLHADVWPSGYKFESEIVAMTAHLQGGSEPARNQHFPGPICGTVTSGGTESILLAMKAYRDLARETRGITRPEIIAPVSAHAAFDKAAQYFGIKLVRIPVGQDLKADLPRTQRAINKNTVALVGSAPCFPHGVIDPIEGLSELARSRGIGFHTDACLGGFILPFARKLGYPVPAFDFSLPGVTSLSADTHKYGYAAKGTSVVLYRGLELRRAQFYAIADWPGGLYFSPTFAGTRPGALSAVCWAAMVSLGEEGYLKAAQKILETGQRIKQGLAEIPELRVLGDPLFCVAFAADTLDIYQILDRMTRRKWSLNGLHRPPAVHICLTLRHAQPGVAERFLADLRESIAEVKKNPAAKEGLAPIYGMAATFPLRGMLNDLLKRYLERLYETRG